MTTTSRVATALLGAGVLAVLGAFLGCNAVLGIHQATIDPTLDDGGGEAASDDAPGQPADAGGGAADGSGGGATDGADPLNCANYCNVIMQNCTGLNQEYLTTDVCMTLCNYMLPGKYYAPSDTPENKDTLGCRLWHATVAGGEPGEPNPHCRHAGPLGTELCGGPCAPFCNLDYHYCIDDHMVSVYGGQAQNCETACEGDAGFEYDEGDSGDLTDPTGNQIHSGNTLNCRLWHLETAIQTGSFTAHCPHTDAVSTMCF